MRQIPPGLAWFLGFCAVFAALVGYVFWGTWSLDVAPVMPDSWTTYSPTFLADHLAGILESGRFVPDDLKVFLGGPWAWQDGGVLWQMVIRELLFAKSVGSARRQY